MKLYNFANLISKYSVTFYLHKTQGKYVSGKWEKDDDVVKEMRGAIVPLSDTKIYQSGGTYDKNDRELYMTEPIPEPLSEWRLEYKGKTYTVENGRDFSDYADVAVYNLKAVNTDA